MGDSSFKFRNRQRHHVKLQRTEALDWLNKDLWLSVSALNLILAWKVRQDRMRERETEINSAGCLKHETLWTGKRGGLKAPPYLNASLKSVHVSHTTWPWKRVSLIVSATLELTASCLIIFFSPHQRLMIIPSVWLTDCYLPQVCTRTVQQHIAHQHGAKDERQQ